MKNTEQVVHIKKERNEGKNEMEREREKEGGGKRG